MRRALAIAGLMVLAPVVACQALLDVRDAPAPGDAAAISDAGAEGGPAVALDAAAEASTECSLGRYYCSAFRACVDRSDPDFGCGAADCRPCGGVHATSVRCVPGDGGALACRPTCASGFADCDGDPANGCETKLGTVSDCQGCGMRCTSSSFCVTGPATAECTPVCTSTVCSGECVDLATSAEHCGKCETACPRAANATGRCVNGSCVIECVAGAHSCGGVCVQDSDPTNCGPECVDCTTGLINATSVSCQEGTCRFDCYAGFGDCDRIAMNGCETYALCGQ